MRTLCIAAGAAVIGGALLLGIVFPFVEMVLRIPGVPVQ